MFLSPQSALGAPVCGSCAARSSTTEVKCNHFKHEERGGGNSDPAPAFVVYLRFLTLPGCVEHTNPHWRQYGENMQESFI